MKSLLLFLWLSVSSCHCASFLGKRKLVETNQVPIDDYRAYVVDKLKDKIFQATGSRPSKEIPWGSVEVKNWPSSVWTMCPSQWNYQDVMEMVMNVDEVEISLADGDNSLPLTEAKEFHDRLVETLRCINYATEKHINWSKLRQSIPELNITSTSYKHWQARDLKAIQKLVLETFVPERHLTLIMDALEGPDPVDESRFSTEDLRKYVNNQLVNIYHRDTGDFASKRVRWSKVQVSGWPVSVPCLRKSIWTDGHIKILFRSLASIRMTPISTDANFGETRSNSELRAQLLQELRPLGFVQRNLINWRAIRRECPSVVLSTASHTRWTPADRKLIQELLLDKFIPEQKVKVLFIDKFK